MEKVTLFVAFLGAQGLSVSMIESYLAALWHFRMLIGPSASSPSFHSPLMAVLLRGIKRCQAQGPRSVRLPSSASLMHQIKVVLSQQSDACFRHLWEVCCVVFFFWLSLMW